MYGLLLENLAGYVKVFYGEDKWDEVRREAGISSTSFSVHESYDEELLMKLTAIAQKVSLKCIKFFLSIKTHSMTLKIDLCICQIKELFSGGREI